MNTQREERKQKMTELYGLGLTLQQVGDRYGISRERVRQIIHDIRPKRLLRQKIEIKELTTATVIEGTCFSCKKNLNRFAPRSHVFEFCEDCFTKFFVRKSGSQVSGMDRTREIVRIRDHHTCQSCGNVWVYGQRRFDIHHLNGNCGKFSTSYDSVLDIDGLVTLCHKCHMNLESVREKIANKSSPRPNKATDYRRKYWEKLQREVEL